MLTLYTLFRVDFLKRLICTSYIYTHVPGEISTLNPVPYPRPWTLNPANKLHNLVVSY